MQKLFVFRMSNVFRFGGSCSFCSGLSVSGVEVKEERFFLTQEGTLNFRNSKLNVDFSGGPSFFTSKDVWNLCSFPIIINHCSLFCIMQMSSFERFHQPADSIGLNSGAIDQKNDSTAIATASITAKPPCTLSQRNFPTSVSHFEPKIYNTKLLSYAGHSLQGYGEFTFESVCEFVH
jgi:hypothetical protein